jgi:hypothetical protein
MSLAADRMCIDQESYDWFSKMGRFQQRLFPWASQDLQRNFWGIAQSEMVESVS